MVQIIKPFLLLALFVVHSIAAPILKKPTSLESVGTQHSSPHVGRILERSTSDSFSVQNFASSRSYHGTTAPNSPSFTDCSALSNSPSLSVSSHGDIRPHSRSGSITSLPWGTSTSEVALGQERKGHSQSSIPGSPQDDHNSYPPMNDEKLDGVLKELALFQGETEGRVTLHKPGFERHPPTVQYHYDDSDEDDRATGPVQGSKSKPIGKKDRGKYEHRNDKGMLRIESTHPRTGKKMKKDKERVWISS